MNAPPADPGRVRHATEGDAEEVLSLCRSLYEENGVGDMNEDKVRGLIRRAVEPGRNDPAFIGVIGAPGFIQASICLVIEPMWYGDFPFLQELWNYVLPQHRNTSNSKDLIAFAKRMSEPFPVGIGLPLWIGILSNYKTEAKVRLYRKQLGEPSGAFWLYGAETGQGVH